MRKVPHTHKHIYKTVDKSYGLTTYKIKTNTPHTHNNHITYMNCYDSIITATNYHKII